jgi:hypothetical protein
MDRLSRIPAGAASGTDIAHSPRTPDRLATTGGGGGAWWRRLRLRNRRLLLRLGAAAALAAVAAPARTEPPSAAGAVPETAPAAVEGFRSARWGMNEAEVKAAIATDFGIPPGRVSSAENATERTTVLSTTVANLLDSAGTARLSYILGYKSRKLIQVTILWGTAVDPQVPPEHIVTAANQLRELFLRSGYQPKTIIANSRLADGSILVFEGQDAAGRTTMLRLADTPSPAKAPGGKSGIAEIALSLSYVLDRRDPDVFHLRRGQF